MTSVFAKIFKCMFRLNNIHVAQTDVEAVEIEVVVAAEVVADLVIEGVDEEDHEVRDTLKGGIK